MVVTSVEFASLLCSRLCHDLISPVGAVVNGIEVMAFDGISRSNETVSMRP